MTTISPLEPQQLYRSCDLDQFTFRTTAEIADLTEIIGQARALDAVRFGSGIRQEGYNLFVLGSPGMGKHSLCAAVSRNQGPQRTGISGLVLSQ